MEEEKDIGIQKNHQRYFIYILFARIKMNLTPSTSQIKYGVIFKNQDKFS